MGSAETRALLNVPNTKSVKYPRNFIKLAVCELRFPTVLEFETHPAPEFVKSIRREYPTYQRIEGLNIRPGGIDQSSGHGFRSRDQKWAVVLRSAALTLETNSYTTFEDLDRRLSLLISALHTPVDSDFFTRVGLRYINAFPFQLSTIGDWVNECLVAALANRTYGDVQEHSQLVRGFTPIGGFVFRHGAAVSTEQQQPSEYTLDFDFYSENVDVTKARSLLKELHDLAFSMFRWSLGPKALEYLEGRGK